MYGYSVPKKVTLLESHLTWIPDFLPPLKPEDESISGSVQFDLKEHLTLIIQKETTEQIAAAEEGRDEGNKTVAGFMGEKLTNIALLSYVGNLSAAKEMLQEVRQTVEDVPDLDFDGIKKAHLNAFKYCADTAEYQIQILEASQKEKENVTPQEDVSATKGVKEGLSQEELLLIWENHCKNDEFMATIHFFKGFLADGLKLMEAEALNQFIKSMELDPKNHVWCHHAYWRIRQLRRRQRDPNNCLPPPSQEEWKYLEMALKLAPNHPVVMLDHALILKEDLWFQDPYLWYPAKIQACVNAFSTLLEVGERKKVSMWNKDKVMLKAKVFFAEFLLFGRGKGLDWRRGKALLEQCAEDYPNSTDVFHKLAKMYHRGPQGFPRLRSDGAAETYYLQSLDKCSTNYGCLMDYIKLLRKKHNYSKIAEVVDNFLKKSMREKPCVTLLIDKGFLIWMFNPRNCQYPKEVACKCWIDLLTKHPFKSQELYNAIKNAPNWVSYSLPKGREVFVLEVIKELEQVKKAVADDEKVSAVITSFIEELKKPNEKDLSSDLVGYFGGLRL